MGQHRQPAQDGGRFVELEPLVPCGGDVGAADGGEGALGELQCAPGADDRAFRLGALLAGKDLVLVAIERFFQRGVLCLAAADPYTAGHLGLGHRRPGVGFGLGGEGLVLRWVALAPDLDGPLVGAALAYGCHASV